MTPPPTSRDDLLLERMRVYGFVLPRNAIEWRSPTDETGAPLRGSMPSISIHSCVLLATDGIVAYFVLGDDKTLLFGHLAAFVVNKKGPAGDKKRKASTKPSKVQAALDLLNEHFNTK